MSPDRLLNERLRAAFENLKKIPYFSGAHGDSVDSTLFNKLAEQIKAKKISAEAWKKTDAFEPLRRNCQRKIFGFNMMVPEVLIVDKPNGSQNWPDALVIYKSKGLPIEFKSAGQDKIVWNSGLPQPDGIYIFNGITTRDDQQTTFFLGAAILSEVERRVLTSAAAENQDAAKTFNETLITLDSKWSLYARPMYNCGDKYLGHPKRYERELEVLAYIDSFTWDQLPTP